MQMACSWKLRNAFVCILPPLSDRWFFLVVSHFYRYTSMFHFSRRSFQILFPIHLGFLPSLWACLSISESLWEALEWNFFLILSLSSVFHVTFLYIKLWMLYLLSRMFQEVWKWRKLHVNIAIGKQDIEI